MLKSSMSQMLLALAAGLSGGDKIRAANSKKRQRPARQRDPQNPHQAALISAAHAKRFRKREKLEHDTALSHLRQGAHNVWPIRLGVNGRPLVHTSLNPFYVNRG